YLDEAENCAEVIVLNEGKVLFEGDPKAMTASMAGRVFHVRGAGSDRRKLLSNALHRADVIDGVLQGEAIRLVMAEGASPPQPAELDNISNLTIAPAAARFEDAFVAALGGQPKRTLALEGGIQSASSAPPVEAKALTRRFGSFTAADN